MNMKSIKLCKVVNMNSEVLLPEQDVEITATDELLEDLNKGFESIEQLKDFLNGKYKIEIL